ncbi:hypothetical protein Pmar_PMAR007434 [Perkinsus marinus ATCC 50983]|uniref:Uncharacterized protein n=1 Tax=Perkinsus marinus (strain ATCC 50983 / TXsc) TaxID=423536 RepID=C5L969_PERM5|nr:hypothetical protein Pmar_PMAR007434 [Perkinsus marinus ATCC 50983]EER06717.1 hypothetical protein Pmar_PMAR007434 [Perkinsus marinus ATCC 50983]|eukprot:XP_002774901.1 hypothetical protein Pmar_PMAR007434 [Perkinsus marinus ATCC 50983]
MVRSPIVLVVFRCQLCWSGTNKFWVRSVHLGLIWISSVKAALQAFTPRQLMDYVSSIARRITNARRWDFASLLSTFQEPASTLNSSCRSSSSEAYFFATLRHMRFFIFVSTRSCRVESLSQVLLHLSRCSNKSYTLLVICPSIMMRESF